MCSYLSSLFLQLIRIWQLFVHSSFVPMTTLFTSVLFDVGATASLARYLFQRRPKYSGVTMGRWVDIDTVCYILIAISIQSSCLSVSRDDVAVFVYVTHCQFTIYKNGKRIIPTLRKHFTTAMDHCMLCTCGLQAWKLKTYKLFQVRIQQNVAGPNPEARPLSPLRVTPTWTLSGRNDKPFVPVFGGHIMKWLGSNSSTIPLALNQFGVVKRTFV